MIGPTCLAVFAFSPLPSLAFLSFGVVLALSLGFGEPPVVLLVLPREPERLLDPLWLRAGEADWECRKIQSFP